MTVSLVLLLLSKDVCMAFSFEASMLSGKWLVLQWNVPDKSVSKYVLGSVSLTNGTFISV